jgi:hypothetical protein
MPREATLPLPLPLNTGMPLKSRLPCAKFLCDLFFDSCEMIFHSVHFGRCENLTFVSIQERCYTVVEVQ